MQILLMYFRHDVWTFDDIEFTKEIIAKFEDLYQSIIREEHDEEYPT